MMRQIVLDTETTGLNPEMGHRVIEIGGVEVVNRRATGRTFHVYLNPDRDIDAGAVEVHGLTADFLADKPRFPDVADDFLAFIAEAELIIHNAPFDLGFIVNRTLQLVRPRLFIMMETEIWPNFLREARRRGVPVVFANARISETSSARFKRWRFLIGEFFVRVLQDAELFLAQTSEDAARLGEMGAPEGRVEVTGNLKYDAEPPDICRFGVWLEEQIRRQERWPVLVAGSVVAGEEEAVLAAYDIVQRQWRRALLVMAPRKPDCFDAAASIAASSGWNVVRRSQLDLTASLDENTDVLVLDSIGELAGLYLFADAVFVGGSLVPAGGHNILEPAWFSRPPVFGPSMENFRDMASQFLSAQAGVQVTSGAQLGKVWAQLIENDRLRERMGVAARALSERNRGATARSLDRIAAALGQQGHSA